MFRVIIMRSYFLRWSIGEDDKIRNHHTIYHKGQGTFIDTHQPIINDLSGGTLERLENCFEIDGYEYLEFIAEPYVLKEELLTSGKSSSEEIAKKIDEEGNPVLVWARLKKEHSAFSCTREQTATRCLEKKKYLI